MKIVRRCASASLGLGVVPALAVGCSTDDKKVAPGEGGAGGEATGGEGPSSGGSQSSGATSGSSTGGVAGEGMGPEAGGSGEGGGGESDPSSGGVAQGGSGSEAGASSGDGSGEAGAGGAAISEPMPLPTECLGCVSDFCVVTRVACQNDAICVACRDEDVTAPACGQNAAFTDWLECICATGCADVCASVCQ